MNPIYLKVFFGVEPPPMLLAAIGVLILAGLAVGAILVLVDKLWREEE